MTPDAWGGSWGAFWGAAWGKLPTTGGELPDVQHSLHVPRRRTRSRRLLPVMTPAQAIAIDLEDEELALQLLGMM